MERKTQLRPADSSQNLPLQSYNAGFKWIWQPKNETLVSWRTYTTGRWHGGKTADWLKNPLSWSILKRLPLTICGCKRVSKMSEPEHFTSGSIEQQEILWIFTQLELLLVAENAVQAKVSMLQMLAWFFRFLCVLFFVLWFLFSVGVVFILCLIDRSTCLVYLQYFSAADIGVQMT